MPVPNPPSGGGAIALVDAPCKPPPAPADLDAQARRDWRALWSEPVAAL
jgi:hypothetical protein